MSNSRIPLSLRLPIGAALAAASPGVAHAADAAAAAEQSASDIVVYGKRAGSNPFADDAAPYKIDQLSSGKFTVPVIDLPKTIAVVPQQLIEDTGATTFRDVMRTQAGITLGTGEGGNAYGDRIFIRGFDARNDIYLDGVRDAGVTSREVFATQQIEILKGPSSSFGGRGTTGGAVNVVSKAPQSTDFAIIAATGGSDETKRVTADVNRELSDTLQVRVNGLFHDGNVAGRDVAGGRRWGGAAAVAWQLTPDLDINLDYYYLATRGTPDWGVAFDGRTQEPFDVPRDTFYGLKQRDFSMTDVHIGTARFEYRFTDKLKLNSRFRYGSNRNAYIASAPEAPNITNPDPAQWTVRANPKNRNALSQIYANVTDARYDFDTGPLKHKLVVGFEISRELVDSTPYAFASSETVGSPVVPTIIITQLLFNPNPDIPWTLFPRGNGTRANTKVSSVGVYALDTVDLTPNLQVSGGVRYDDFRLKFTNIAASGAITQLYNRSKFTNWNAGLVWKPTPATSLYLAAATSSNPSGEQIDGAGTAYGGIAGTTTDLAAEKNRSYEAGGKAQVANGHLLLTAAAFRTEKTNGRVNSPIPGGAQLLTGKQRVDGFELAASGNIVPEWTIYAGYVHLKSKILESTTLAEVGGRFPNIPNDSFALFSSYSFLKRYTVGGQVNYNSTRYGGTTSAGNAHVPAYWRFDVTARAAITSRIEVQLNGLNLSNNPAYDAIYRSATPFAYVAPGRSVLARVRILI